jgi:hypothetical protein
MLGCESSAGGIVEFMTPELIDEWRHYDDLSFHKYGPHRVDR